MKNILFLIIIAGFWTCSSPNKDTPKTEEPMDHSEHVASEPKEAKKPLSPRTASMALVGSNHVHVDYGSPGKRGRMIFGGLVGYGTVWATGAHKATTIKFDENVIINGVDISAGKYGLFTIPGESEWTIIINKDWDMHLADDYNEANDLVRIQAPVRLLEDVVESLTFEVNEADATKGSVTIKWDQTAVSFDVINNKE